MESKFVLFLCLGCFLVPSLFAKTPSVLIIGGAIGLATAIEARQAGYAVTLVEKRESYERRQTVFLLESSLELFKKWEVTVEAMKVIEGEAPLGIVPLQELEMGLEKRALALGVEKIHGEFKEFHGRKLEAVIATPSGIRFLPYDFIVAADGGRSRVREALGIQPIRFGEATAASMLIRFESSQPMEISPTVEKEDFFVRKISLGIGSLVFMQGPCEKPCSEEHLREALKSCGWSEEEKALEAKNPSHFVGGIPIVLAQAPRFSDRSKRALLVGDAAATASFLQGMGANTGLKTAALAGEFFKSQAAGKRSAYQSFEEGMQGATDALIEDSRCLFPSSVAD